MRKFLVKESANYSDEFDVEGFKIVEAVNEEAVIDYLLDDRTFPDELYFGTNEAIYFDSKEEFLEALEIQEISEQEAEILIKLFPQIDKYAFGTTAVL